MPEIHALIEPALPLFVEFFAKLSLQRQNLLFSAILDAFKFIYEEKIQSHIVTLESELKRLPNSQIHSFLDQIFGKYKTVSPLKNLDLSAITFGNSAASFLLRDFLLDNVEEDSAATRNELRKSPPVWQLKPKTAANSSPQKLVNYEDEEEADELPARKGKSRVYSRDF
jgi:hypothetical protein